MSGRKKGRTKESVPARPPTIARESELKLKSMYDTLLIYIFRFRSYLVTDIGRILDAKGGFVNFLEA